jgi:hypothetical protein
MPALSADHRVVMFSRRRCGLCDEARAVILGERRRSRFHFDEVFIDGDRDLEDAYGVRVPVVEIDGVEAFEYHVHPAALQDLLRPAG